MNEIKSLILTKYILILLVSLVGCSKPEVKPVSLNIASGVSLQKPLELIKSIYTQQKPYVTINYNFGSSGENQKSIQNRSQKIDIFITAGAQFMDELQAKGLILPETRKKLLLNKIVLIALKTDTSLTNFPGLTDNKIKYIAISNSQSGSSGSYAREVLNFFGILEQVKPKFIFASNSAETLKLVEEKKANAGIVFATDAIASNQIKIVAIAPAESHSPINYNIAVINGSQNVSDAKEFIQFIQSEQAGAVFVKYGFSLSNFSP